MEKIQALTFDIKKDSWDQSKGFFMREVDMPKLDESRQPSDATSVILKIKYAGVCGTDRGIWYRNVFKDLIHNSLETQGQTQRVLGHEFLGEVVAAGSMVKTLYYDPDPQNIAKVEVGALVSGDSHVTCGTCYQCRIGEANVCMNESILGISINGIFADYVKLPAKNLWPIDQTRVRPEVAAIYDPLGNAVHAVTKVDTRGKRIAVFGCGPIGLFSILLLSNFGAGKVIAVDPDPSRLEMAKKLGAHEVIQIKPSKKEQPYEKDSEVIDRIMELTYGKGVDIAMEMAGPPSSINNAFESVRRGGQVILFGLKDGDLTIPNFSRFIVKGLTIHNVIGRKIFETWQTAQRVLSNQDNGIQEQIWKTILNEGHGTLYDFHSYSPESFEKALNENPKLILEVSK